VAGSFFMARFSRLLPEPVWIIVALIGMGAAGVLYGLSSEVGIALVLVTITGFFNSPSSIARSVLLQRNTPREMRGRVFSAFYVMRDVIFLLGMASAGLADIVNIRVLIVFASSLLFVSAAFTFVAPGLGISTWRAAADRLRASEAAPGLATSPVRAATVADFDLLAGRIGAFTRLSPERRASFLEAATVRQVPTGTRIVEHGDTASSAYFILDGSTTAGIPTEAGYRGLSTMIEGDFFGEIGALTGSPRTADVVADTDTTLLEIPPTTLRSLMSEPAISELILPTLTERLTRTTSADLPRLAGFDQDDLRDLRTPRAAVETVP
jgi:CRP-like cAMP-binding protein